MASLSHSFLDELSGAIDVRIIEWIMDNGYDSDAVIQDVIGSDGADSNIVSAFSEHFDLKKVSEFVMANAIPDVKVVGISGATRSGKSQLTRRIERTLGGDKCTTIHQDHYFDTIKISVQLEGNWDTPDALDHDRLLAKVMNTISAVKVPNPNLYGKCCWVILEGFMMFYDSRLVECIDYFVWLEINKKECYKRRMATKRESKRYFNDWLWPNHQRYRESIFGSDQDNDSLCKDDRFVSIDGTMSYSESLQTTLSHIGATQ